MQELATRPCWRSRSRLAARGGAIELLRALEERQVRFPEAVREPDALRRRHARDTRGVFVTQVVTHGSHGQSIARGQLESRISRDFQSSLRTLVARRLVKSIGYGDGARRAWVRARGLVIYSAFPPL